MTFPCSEKHGNSNVYPKKWRQYTNIVLDHLPPFLAIFLSKPINKEITDTVGALANIDVHYIRLTNIEAQEYYIPFGYMCLYYPSASSLYKTGHYTLHL